MLSHRGSNRNLDYLGKQEWRNRKKMPRKNEKVKKELDAAKRTIARHNEAVRISGTS